MSDKIILPGIGFDSIKFGMSEEEVIAVLGKPDEVEVQEMDDGESVNIYYYDEINVSISFDSMADMRLVEISFDDSSFTLLDKFFPGMSKELFLEHADEIGEYFVEDLSDEGSDVNELYSFEDKNINVWIKEGAVDSIQIGPYWGDDDEEILWPE